MNLKINVPVQIVNWNSTFLVELTEVDTFRDDTLAVKIQNLEGNAMGYRRQRNITANTKVNLNFITNCVLI